MTLTRHHLLDVPVNADVARSRMARLEIGPGGSTGVHRHPCDVVGYLLSGTVRYRIDGAPEQTLHAGDPFHEPKNTRIDYFDNASDTEPAAFVVCYLQSPGVDEVIEML